MIDLVPYFSFLNLYATFFVVIVGIFIHFKLSYRYWKQKGVPYLEPTFPYGNQNTLVHKLHFFAGETRDWYNQLKKAGHKFGGVWSFSRKVLVLVDPDYIRDVLSTDSQQFLTRDAYSNVKWDPKGTHLFNITKPAGWKPLRQKLTPAFVSHRIKMTFDGVMECSKNMLQFIDECAKNNEPFDNREVASAFTIEVIANVAFGVDCDNFDKNNYSEFLKQGTKFFKSTLGKKIKSFFVKLNPDFCRAIGVKSSHQSVRDFFASVVLSTLKYRAENNISRPDFIQLLIDMHAEDPNSPKHLTFDQLVGNTIMFFVAGSDTSSSTMCMALYELANNQELQDKARQEINDILKKNNGEITYDSLSDMVYIKQVIDEAQRKWPPLLSLDRVCTTDYKLRDTDIVIEKGTPVIIPLLGLGRDPDHYPEPERFDPERFNEENKAKRHRYLHLPFGGGPRNCIGLRFGLMLSKVGIAQTIRYYKLSVSPKTPLPIDVEPTVLLLKTKNPVYLTPIKIEKEN